MNKEPNTELRFPEDSDYIDLKDAAAQVYEAYTRSREEGAAEISNVIRAFAASIQAEAQQQIDGAEKAFKEAVYEQSQRLVAAEKQLAEARAQGEEWKKAYLREVERRIAAEEKK